MMEKLNSFEALEQFEALARKVQAAGSNELGNFFNMIQQRYLMATCSGPEVAMAHGSLRTIADDLKTILPENGIVPSENLHNPEDGSSRSFHVDAFLYDDMEVDELVNKKKLPSNYCTKCGSVDVKPVEYISYSSSRERASFIFQSLITKYLKGMTVLDIGSRIGSILYGAYYFSAADRIIGVEMNQELCTVQNKIVEKHGLGDRIQIVNGNILDHAELLRSADVIVMNNVFEHFIEDDNQLKIWSFLRENITKSKTLIVTSPKLEESLSKLKAPIDVSKWVEEINLSDPLSAMFQSDHAELGTLHLYQVL